MEKLKKDFNWNWISFIFLGRVFTASTFFMYVGSMSHLIKIWDLSATEAGMIQTGLVVGFAVALYLSSYYCDFINPNHILIFSSFANLISALLFTYFANDFYTGLFFNFLLGCSSGGIYGPSMVLVSEKFSKNKKGFAMGIMLGGQSLGYALSLSISFIYSNFYNAKNGFIICTILTAIGLFCFYYSVFEDLSKKLEFKIRHKFKMAKQSIQNQNLIKGYMAHCVELFGMWTWTPVFLGIVLIGKANIDPIILAVLITALLHITGLVSNIISGYYSDKLGNKIVLIFFAATSALLSFLIGWTSHWYWILVLMIGIFYSFFAIGDSNVLTSSLTSNTSRNILGRSLAYRSILGIGFGSLTPGAFGLILDLTNNHEPISTNTNWIYAFSFLGFFGLAAAFFATKLKVSKSS